MDVELEPILVEEAVFLVLREREAGGDPEAPRLRAEIIEPAYEVAEPRGRERAFRKAYREVFERLGLRNRLETLIAGEPLVAERLDRLFLPRAVSSREEEGELFKAGGTDGEAVRWTGVIKLRPERFLPHGRLEPYLRHELRRIADLIDPAFDYTPDLGEGDPTPEGRVRLNLLKDRYRVLWDLWIEARLARRGLPEPQPELDALRRLFERAFRRLTGDERRELWNRVWEARDLRHAELLELARTAPRLAGA